MGTGMLRRTKESFKDYIQWFEIPVLDIKRAVEFYNTIYQFEMEMVEYPNHAMAFFPPNNGIGGSLIQGHGCKPTENGTLIYLTGGKDLNTILSRIDSAGGRVIMEKTLINEESGYFALFIDSEGNKLALHSKK